MSNMIQNMPPTATGGNLVPLVAAPASASASASVSSKEPLPKLEQRLGRADWDTLLEERIGIMLDSGISLGRARALATHDTTLRYGTRPSPEAP